MDPVVLSCVAAILSSAFAAACPNNEIYSTCASPAYCQAACPDQPVRFCPAVCVKGCLCSEGFVRETTGGRCIPRSLCPKCAKNEQFTTCGPPLPPTCDNPLVVSDQTCRRTCICKPGFIRQKVGGPCISEEKCPALRCSDNEVFSNCTESTRCQPNCSGVPLCIEGCQRGCRCQDGFVRRTLDGECIAKDKC